MIEPTGKITVSGESASGSGYEEAVDVEDLKSGSGFKQLQGRAHKITDAEWIELGSQSGTVVSDNVSTYQSAGSSSPEKSTDYFWYVIGSQ